MVAAFAAVYIIWGLTYLAIKYADRNDPGIFDGRHKIHYRR